MYTSWQMRLLLFFLIFSFVESASIRAIKKLYLARNYRGILKEYSKDPGSFSTPAQLEILALTHKSLGNFGKVIRVCAQVMEESSSENCSKLLFQMKKSKPNLYQRELGWYYMERGETQSAFVKFYSLIRKNPDDQDVRRGLLRIFQTSRAYDHMLEQLWQMTPTEETRSLQQWLKLVRIKFRKRLLKQDLELIEGDLYSYYTLLFLSQKTHPNYYEPLLSLYKERSETEGTEEDQVRYANLLFIGGKLKETREIADRLEGKLQHPVSILSLEALLKRLPPKPKPPEKIQSLEQASTEGSRENVILAPEIPASHVVEETEPDLLQPFDFSELKFATLEDLKPFEDLHMDFKKRLARTKNEGERRWVFEQVREKLMEMDSSHLDPTKHPVEKYFHSEDGKRFGEKLEKLRQEALKTDRKNSRVYEGELEKIRSEISSAPGKEDRQRILKQFYYRWKTTSENQFLDPRVRGAWEYYLESPEGTRLLEYVQDEVDKLGLKQNQTPFTRVWQY